MEKFKIYEFQHNKLKFSYSFSPFVIFFSLRRGHANLLCIVPNLMYLLPDLTLVYKYIKNTNTL